MRPHENELEPSSPMGPPKIIAPPQSILKDRHGRHGSVERRRSRHASSESSGPPTPRAVTFDKSVYNFRSVASESEVMPRPSQRTLRDRRTSLPVASHAQLLSRAPVQSNVSEARGLVMDMLTNRDLAPNVASCLRAVAALLNTQSGTMHNFMLSDLGLPSVVENPYSGEQLTISPVNGSKKCF